MRPIQRPEAVIDAKCGNSTFFSGEIADNRDREFHGGVADGELEDRFSDLPRRGSCRSDEDNARVTLVKPRVSLGHERVEVSGLPDFGTERIVDPRKAGEELLQSVRIALDQRCQIALGWVRHGSLLAHY
jgi:hypothetical protein